VSLADHYRRFRVTERVLLTGHSHQAWPDVAFDGVVEAFEDAARFVDGKWDRAEAKAEAVRDGFRRLIGDASADIALGANTHELVVRMLSALPWRERTRLVTTSGEFHSVRRQLEHLAQVGEEVVVVDADPVDTLAARVADAVDDTTLAVLVSSVLFASGRIVPGLAALADACAARGAELLLDLYHQLGAVPFDGRGLERAWLTGGGYKYLQLGEGNCFLRVPRHAAEMRPLYTGWFAEFEGHAWNGATYDPTSHYRAARVFAFFEEHGLTPDALRATSLRQTTYLAERLGIDEDRARFGGFVALRHPDASALRDGLRAQDIHTDVRGDVLRIGPAPYVSDAQLERAADALSAMMR
jgi:kynureninase